MRDIVETTVLGQPDMDVVATVDAPVSTGLTGARDALGSAIVRSDADVVIIGLEDEDAVRECDTLLYLRPRLRLFAITGDGRGAVLCELRPHRVPVGDVSPAGLVAAIRGAIGAGTS